MLESSRKRMLAAFLMVLKIDKVKLPISGVYRPLIRDKFSSTTFFGTFLKVNRNKGIQYIEMERRRKSAKGSNLNRPLFRSWIIFNVDPVQRVSKE